MMMQILIALAAGAASALMFASIVSGAIVSLVLFYLAPLPLMVAGLGWSAMAALIGGVAASLGLGIVFGLPYMFAFALTVALPAWQLARLTLLAQPAEVAQPATASLSPSSDPKPDAMIWYPTGRLLIWAAIFASLTTAAALLSLGSNPDDITAALRRGLMRVLGARDPAATPDDATERLMALLAAAAPAAATVVAFMTMAINLWLAGRIARTSGRLRRPWPALRDTVLPPMTLVALPVALALCFVGGLIAMLAQIVAAALLAAYMLTGFAVLHTVTRTNAMRGLWLGSAYASVLVFGWPAILMMAIGIADAAFNLRQRLAARAPPPSTVI